MTDKSNDRVVAETLGGAVKVVEKKPEAVRNYKGAFFTLRSAKLVDPLDEAEYSATQMTMMKSQGLVFVFSLFWAHMIDKGSFLKAGASRIPLYAVAVGVPAAIHAFFATSTVTQVISDMDQKYAPLYAKYYADKIKNPQLKSDE